MDAVTMALAGGSVALAAAGQVLLRLSQAVAPGGAAGIRLSWPLAAGLLMHSMSAGLWILALGRAPLSRLYPMTAATQVLVPLAAWVLLGERPGPALMLAAALAAGAAVAAGGGWR